MKVGEITYTIWNECSSELYITIAHCFHQYGIYLSNSGPYIIHNFTSRVNGQFETKWLEAFSVCSALLEDPISKRSLFIYIEDFALLNKDYYLPLLQVLHSTFGHTYYLFILLES